MSNGHADIKAHWRRPYVLGGSHSGRIFVAASVVVIAVLCGVLFLIFRDWRARHRELAAFGASEVAPIVDPLAAMVPPGVEPKAWHRAVEDTHGMLLAATGSGMMDRSAMERLRDDLRARVIRCSRDTVQAELRSLWDEMQKGFGPILTGRSSKPPLCPDRPKLLAPPSAPSGRE